MERSVVVVARRRRDEGGQRRPDAPFSLPANRCVNSPLGHVVLELALEDVLYAARVHARTRRLTHEARGARRAARGVRRGVWGRRGRGGREACMHACDRGVCVCGCVRVYGVRTCVCVRRAAHRHASRRPQETRWRWRRRRRRRRSGGRSVGLWKVVLTGRLDIQRGAMVTGAAAWRAAPAASGEAVVRETARETAGAVRMRLRANMVVMLMWRRGAMGSGERRAKARLVNLQ